MPNPRYLFRSTTRMRGDHVVAARDQELKGKFVTVAGVKSGLLLRPQQHGGLHRALKRFNIEHRVVPSSAEVGTMEPWEKKRPAMWRHSRRRSRSDLFLDAVCDPAGFMKQAHAPG